LWQGLSRPQGRNLLQSDKDQNCGDLLPDRLDFEIDVHRDGEVVPPPSKVSPERHQESPTETPQNNEHEVNIDASSISIDPSLNGAHESGFPSVGDYCGTSERRFRRT
jgi:hypothetical protein